MPRIFVVNWFRKDDDGKFLWPGYGENSRVLEWVFRRCNGEAEAGRDADRSGAGGGRAQRRGARDSPEAVRELTSVDGEAVKAQLPQVEEHLARFGEKLPERDPQPARGARGAPRLTALRQTDSKEKAPANAGAFSRSVRARSLVGDRDRPVHPRMDDAHEVNDRSRGSGDLAVVRASRDRTRRRRAPSRPPGGGFPLHPSHACRHEPGCDGCFARRTCATSRPSGRCAPARSNTQPNE